MKTSSNQKKAFTLIELIIVIAIIGVLIAILIPAFTGFVKDSETQACNDYRKALLSQYATKTLEKENYTLAAFLTDEELTCPYGGQYTAAQTDEGKAVILCSLHEGDQEIVIDPGTYLPNNLRDQMDQLRKLYDSLSKEEQHALAGWGSNDEMRKALSNKYYEGLWPEFPQSLIDKYGIKVPAGNVLYIQPFLNKSDSNNIVIFARANEPTSDAAQKAGWYTNLVYDHETGLWYKGIANNAMSVTSPWADIKAALSDPAKWQPLK